MRISLAAKDGALTATISGVKGHSVEYCFYLLRDGDTVRREAWSRVPR